MFTAPLLLVGACSSGYEAPKSFTVSDSAVSSAVKSAIEETSAGLDGHPEVSCTGRERCSIEYTVKDPAGISTNIELIRPTRQLWKTLFTDPKFKSGVITVKGPTKTPAGKDGTGTLFALTCTRKQARQIDWDSTNGSEIRKHCDFAPKVTGL